MRPTPSTWFRHERRDLLRVERVEVDGDVGAGGPVERRAHRAGAHPDPVRGDELLLRRIEVAGPDQRDIARVDSAGVQEHPQGRCPLVVRRRALDRVQVAVRVEPDDRDPSMARGQRLDGADVGAAATPEDDRALRQLERERQALLGERVLLDHGGLGVRQRQARRFGHRLAVPPPGARHPHEPCRERAPADVALVVRAERDRRVRPALGALGAQSRQDAETLPTRASSRRYPIGGRRASLRSRRGDGRR